MPETQLSPNRGGICLSQSSPKKIPMSSARERERATAAECVSHWQHATCAPAQLETAERASELDWETRGSANACAFGSIECKKGRGLRRLEPSLCVSIPVER